ncbi:MAG: PIG-L deacetylase family protein, partial [Mycobacteriales bacterium]
DRAAMNELGAHPLYREFLDAIYRHVPNDSWLCDHNRAIPDNLPPDRSILLGKVTHEVRNVLTTVNPDLVLTCAAVGNHIDHKLTRAAVLHAATRTEASILLWEDLPYAVGRPSETTQHSTRPITAEAWERKWRAISCYATQVRILWPAGTDWPDQLLTHAHARGGRCPAEALFSPCP